MPLKIFFSWQADTSTTVGRNLVERALERALRGINADAEIDEALRELEVDRDTKDVAGSPPIVDTIFRKVDEAAVFVPDLTFIGERLSGRPTPNPNVLIEYGWALKSLGHGRIVPVMNTAFGEPTAEAMPFDMRHLRNPICYHCSAEASEEERRQAREGLSKQLEGAIRAVLESEAFRSSQAPVPPPVYQSVEEQGGCGRFRRAGDPLGIRAHAFDKSPIYLDGGPSIWLRVMPIADPARRWAVSEIKAAAEANVSLEPINHSWRSLGHIRGHDGFGVFESFEDNIAVNIGYIFCSGEVWGIDTALLSACTH